MLAKKINTKEETFRTLKSRKSQTCLFIVGFQQAAFIGKILGIIPFGFLKGRSGDYQKYKRLTFSRIYSGVLTIHSFLHFLHQLWNLRIRLPRYKLLIQKLELIRSPVYGFSVCFIYLHFFLNSENKLTSIINKRKNINASLSSQLRSNRKYPIFCTMTIIVILGSSILENLLFDVQYFTEKEKYSAKNASRLELYYWRSGNAITSITPYSPILSIVTTVLSKFATYVWNVSDILVIILCKSLSDLINAFSELISSKFQTARVLRNGASTYHQDTEKLLSDFFTIRTLAAEITGFLAPLVVTCYCYNMCLMTMHLFHWLDPRGIGDTEKSMYVYTSFLQFSLRVILVTYHASKIHHSTEQIEETLELVPDELYSQTIERLERQLSRNPVGISLFGTFRVTRRFFISIVSFLFTTEIVLLQTAGPTQVPMKI